MNSTDRDEKWRSRKQLATVADVVAFLQTLPQDAFLTVNGQEYCLTTAYDLEGASVQLLSLQPDLGAPEAFWAAERSRPDYGRSWA